MNLGGPQEQGGGQIQIPDRIMQGFQPQQAQQAPSRPTPQPPAPAVNPQIQRMQAEIPQLMKMLNHPKLSGWAQQRLQTIEQMMIQANDPMAAIQREKAQLELQKMRRDIDTPQDSIQMFNEGQIGKDKRTGQWIIPPTAENGQSKAYRTKLDQERAEQDAQQIKRQNSAPNIAAGLNNLNQMADKYNNSAFESAVGPFRGSTPDSLLGSVPINIARIGGEVMARLGDANAVPSEVRSNITGATEALAGAIKPLIRGPGEGAWTDADQARLVAIVGDLAQARDKTEFRRRLNDVRDRIKTNFGIDFNFNSGAQPLQGGSVTGGGQLPPPQNSQSAPPDAVKMLRANPTPQMQKFFDEQFGQGAAQRAMGGR